MHMSCASSALQWPPAPSAFTTHAVPVPLRLCSAFMDRGSLHRFSTALQRLQGGNYYVAVALEGQQAVYVATNCALLWDAARYREVAELLHPGVQYAQSIAVHQLARPDPSVRRQRVDADAVMEAAARVLPPGARMISAVGAIQAGQAASTCTYSMPPQLAPAMQALPSWPHVWQPALLGAAIAPSIVEPVLATMQEDLDAITGARAASGGVGVRAMLHAAACGCARLRAPACACVHLRRLCAPACG